MLYDVMRAYPDLGSFLYGHCKDIDMSATGFIVLCCVLFALLALLLVGGVGGYVLQSIALCRIAKRYGAGKKLRTKACFPFLRYFTSCKQRFSTVKHRTRRVAVVAELCSSKKKQPTTRIGCFFFLGGLGHLGADRGISAPVNQYTSRRNMILPFGTVKLVLRSALSLFSQVPLRRSS